MDNSHYPKFVVTCLRDQQPVAVVEVQQETEQSEAVELFYPTASHLPDVLDALRAAARSVEFYIWKTTGVLPAPRDYVSPSDDELAELPF